MKTNPTISTTHMIFDMGLRGLPYNGGKKRSWIVDFINDQIGPTPPGWAYVEPFAGMGGILLSRPKANIEIINDLDGWIYSWWKAVRDYPDELKWQLKCTPYSRRAYELSCEHIAKGITEDIVNDAYHATIVIAQSLIHATNAKPYDWGRVFVSTNINRNERHKIDMIGPISERIKDIQLENRDALKLLNEIAHKEKILIYCDPPYKTKWKNVSYVETIDYDAMTDLLKAQSGRVCISGYSDEWDHLGWTKSSVNSHFASFKGDDNIGSRQRVESVWRNFDHDTTQGTLNI